MIYSVSNLSSPFKIEVWISFFILSHIWLMISNNQFSNLFDMNVHKWTLSIIPSSPWSYKAYLVMTCAIHGHETGWPCTTAIYIHPLHAKWIKNIIKREIRVFFTYLIWAFMLKYPYMNQISFLYVSLHGISGGGC